MGFRFYGMKKILAAALLVIYLGGCAGLGQERAEVASEDATAKQVCTPVEAGQWKETDEILLLGDRALTYGDLKEILKEWQPNAAALEELDTNEQQKFFKKYYIEQLFVAEALKRGLDKTDEFAARTLALRLRMLVPVYKQREIVDKYKPTAEELYQYIPPAEDEVQVRIIVKESGEEAREIYERARAGEDFDALARAESEGNLRDLGGLTGFMSPSTAAKFPAPVIRRFLAEPVGALLEPFFQDIGFLVVKIEAKRSAAEIRDMEMERRRSELVYNIHKHYYEKRLDELWKEATVVFREDAIAALAEKEGDPKAVVIEVNGTSFTGDEVLGDMETGMHGSQSIRQRVERFLPVALVGMEALRLGLDKDPLFTGKWRVEWSKELANELKRVELQPIEEAPVTDEEIDVFAQARPDRFMEPEARWLRVILALTEAEATQAVERLEKGEDFAEVARGLSAHKETAEKGGDMGYVSEKSVPRDVKEAIFSLEEGRYTEPLPVTLEIGKPAFLIVKVEGVRKAAPVPPERVRTPNIENEIRTRKRASKLAGLVEKLEMDFGYKNCTQITPQ